MFTLKQTCVERTPLLRGHRHQKQAILLRETCIKQTLQVSLEDIFYDIVAMLSASKSVFSRKFSDSTWNRQLRKVYDKACQISG